MRAVHVSRRGERSELARERTPDSRRPRRSTHGAASAASSPANERRQVSTGRWQRTIENKRVSE
jgi:hypothetical protein